MKSAYSTLVDTIKSDQLMQNGIVTESTLDLLASSIELNKPQAYMFTNCDLDERNYKEAVKLASVNINSMSDELFDRLMFFVCIMHYNQSREVAEHYYKPAILPISDKIFSWKRRCRNEAFYNLRPVLWSEDDLDSDKNLLHADPLAWIKLMAPVNLSRAKNELQKLDLDSEYVKSMNYREGIIFIEKMLPELLE